MAVSQVWGSWKRRATEQIRAIVFGLGDSLVSTTGAVTGIAAGSGDRLSVILSGLVVIFVESISMSAGEYLSSKSEREVDEGALSEELRQIRENPEQERRELVEFYRERGFSEAETALFANRIMQSEERILEEMAHRELQVPYPPRLEPGQNAWYIGVSYMLGGIIPILPYVFLPLVPAMVASNLSALAALFLIGAIKGRLVGVSPLRSGIEMALISLAAAAVGYGVGRLASLWLR